MLKKASIYALAGAGVAMAQTSTAALPAASAMTIIGGTYDGQAVTGHHVGAAASYQVVNSKGAAGATNSQIYFDLTSNMYMDESIASTPLPCYIIKDSSIAGGNAGPLECGAATSTNYITTGIIGTDGTVQFNGVQSWWVCDANATAPYGVVSGTLVAGFSTSQPSGSGIANCVSAPSVKLIAASSSSSSTSSSSTVSQTSTSSASASATTTSASSGSSSQGSSSASTTSSASSSQVSSTTSASVSGTTSTPAGWNSWVSSSASPVSSTSSSVTTTSGWDSATASTSSTSSEWSTSSAPMATYTGGAVANGMSSLGLMVAAGGLALMI